MGKVKPVRGKALDPLDPAFNDPVPEGADNVSDSFSLFNTVVSTDQLVL
jgi:hypothetical protein